MGFPQSFENLWAPVVSHPRPSPVARRPSSVVCLPSPLPEPESESVAEPESVRSRCRSEPHREPASFVVFTIVRETDGHPRPSFRHPSPIVRRVLTLDLLPYTRSGRNRMQWTLLTTSSERLDIVKMVWPPAGWCFLDLLILLRFRCSPGTSLCTIAFFIREPTKTI